MNMKTSFLNREVIQDKAGENCHLKWIDKALTALMKPVSFFVAIGNW